MVLSMATIGFQPRDLISIENGDHVLARCIHKYSILRKESNKLVDKNRL